MDTLKPKTTEIQQGHFETRTPGNCRDTHVFFCWKNHTRLDTGILFVENGFVSVWPPE